MIVKSTMCVNCIAGQRQQQQQFARRWRGWSRPADAGGRWNAELRTIDGARRKLT